MRCPCCHHELRAVVRLGVELACCPACHGTWVGGGAMSRLLARARGDLRGPAVPAGPRRPGGAAWPQEIEFYDFG